MQSSFLPATQTADVSILLIGWNKNKFKNCEALNEPPLANGKFSAMFFTNSITLMSSFTCSPCCE
jgi:hypothetical protein